MKVAILTSTNQWFIPYAKELEMKIQNAKLFFTHKEIDESFDIVFILSYHNLIEDKYLKAHKYNLVIHESALPKGKGWAPMFWQVLDGENKIPFTMFEASQGVDNGDIYMQKILKLTGYELNSELRKKQADFTIGMCLEFLNNYEKYKIPVKQNGIESFYSKRTVKNSELNVNKSLKEQFNLLRIVDNESYPAFFKINNKEYKIKIEEVDNEIR